MIMKTLIDALPALQKLARQDLTTKTLYKVSKLLFRLDEDVAVYNKARNAIIEKYCVIDGDSVKPKQEFTDEFNEKFIELLECEVDDLPELPIEIPLNERISLSFNDLMLIKAFVKIGDE